VPWRAQPRTEQPHATGGPRQFLTQTAAS
jgi:hypothetical protein